MTEPLISPAQESLSQELRDVLDRLGQVFQEAERHLQNLGFGVRAEVPLPSPPGGNLLFGKMGKRWRLLYRPQGGRETVSLLSTHRHVRLCAAPLLPDLVHALQGAAEAELERVREATAEVRAFCEAVEASASLPADPPPPAFPRSEKR